MMVPFPDLELILSEIQARRDWIGAVGHGEFMGIGLVPMNSNSLLRAIVSTTIADSLCDSLHGDIIRLSTGYANEDFSSVSIPALEGAYPQRISSLKDAISALVGKVVVSLSVSDRFRIGGFVAGGTPLAAYSLPTHSEDGSLLVSQRLITANSDGMDLREDIRSPGSQVTFTKTEEPLAERIPTKHHFWSACSGGLMILGEESGKSIGRRVVTFHLQREADFTYLLARRDGQVESQSFVDNLSIEPVTDSQSNTSIDSVAPNLETCLGCDQDFIDARAPLLDMAAERAAVAEDELTSYIQSSESWQGIGESGEVPMWTRSVVISLNGRVLPPPEQVLDVTNLLIDGSNQLTIEYDGAYEWSDLILLECISVSFVGDPPQTISYKCLCFRYLGFLDTLQRGYCSVASVSILAEAVAIGQFKLMRPIKTPLWEHSLTCRPAMVFHGQLVKCSFGVSQQAESWELGLVYINYSTGLLEWASVATGTAAEAYSTSITFTIPSTIPTYRWVLLSLRVDGVEVNTFSLFSFGNNFCGDWRFMRTTSRNT